MVYMTIQHTKKMTFKILRAVKGHNFDDKGKLNS